jgi:hypothetical protein
MHVSGKITLATIVNGISSIVRRKELRKISTACREEKIRWRW